MPAPFDRTYASVPADQREALRAFRETHPLRRATIAGTPWEYLDSGTGERVILLLVGGLRVADAAFCSILRLESEFRIVTPTYPALTTMTALADGLAGLLDAAGVAQAGVLSGSFGGMLAMQFAQRHPARLSRLVLSSTAIPGPAEAASYRRMARLMGWLPARLVLAQMRDRLLAIIDPPEAERAFWTAYLHELFGERLSKAEALSTLHCMVNFAETAPRSPEDLPGWTGDTLLITSDDDHTFGPEAQAALGRVLPGVQVHLLHGAGHSPAMTQPEQFFGAASAFLRGT